MLLRANPNVVPGFEVDEEVIGGETRVSKLEIIFELEQSDMECSVESDRTVIKHKIRLDTGLEMEEFLP
jgi:hypothetical protein